MKAQSVTRKGSVIPNEIIMNQIYMVREQKVMLDKDLAALYNVETKYLNRAVQRNLRRFPSDFMFQLTKQETDTLRFQIGAQGWGGNRRLPYVFTEQGVAMLSGILNSARAIVVNVQIMRVFTNMRKMLLDNTELRLAIEEIRRKTENNTKNIEVVFKYFDEFMEERENHTKRKAPGTISIRTKRKIGFRLPPAKKPAKARKK